MRRIVPLLALATLAACAEGIAPPTLVAGRLSDPAIPECSGVVASRAHPGVLWVHNDSGNPAELFAISADGTTLARFPVAADNIDWEDIALDANGIYLADTGNNRHDRQEVEVLRVDEPDPEQPATAPLAVRARWRLRWPGHPHDCEALLVVGAVGYVIDKRIDHRPGLWRFSLDRTETQVLERVATLPIDAPVTGADLSPDGRRLAVCHPFGLHVFTLPPGPLETVIADAPRDYLAWFDPHQEACCFVPGGVVAISESRTVRWCSDQRIAGGHGAAAATLDLRPAPAALVLDGELAEWGAANALPLVSGPGPGTARVWAGWTTAGVVVAGEVTGSVPLRAGRPWPTGDAAEFFLGEERADRAPEYGPDDDRCCLAPDGGGVILRWPRRSGAPAEARCAGRTVADGYRFEAVLPTRIALTAGDAVRFAVSVLAPRPRRTWYLPLANDAGVWFSPLDWAVARLVR